MIGHSVSSVMRSVVSYAIIDCNDGCLLFILHFVVGIIMHDYSTVYVVTVATIIIIFLDHIRPIREINH